jgi:hypothetical protein
MKTLRTAPRPKTLDERFEGKVNPDPETGCLIWTGAKGSVPGSRYGHIRINGRLQRAHRIAYERAHGPIPKGQVVRHTCHRPLCVNPEHLLVGTQKDNINDMMLAGRGATTDGRKLTSKDAVAMIGMRILGYTLQGIGEAFGVGMTTVKNVLRQRTWPNAIDDELDKDLNQARDAVGAALIPAALLEDCSRP